LLSIPSNFLSWNIKKKIKFTPIGKIHSPYDDLEEMHIQQPGVEGIQRTVEAN